MSQCVCDGSVDPAKIITQLETERDEAVAELGRIRRAQFELSRERDLKYTEQAEALIAGRDELQRVVDELVALKSIKDWLDTYHKDKESSLRGEYNRRKPLAWDAARRLATPQKTQEQAK